MAVMKIITGTENHILRAKSAPVGKASKKIKQLVVDMTDTVMHVSGLGIAAPQVGVNLRIYIARLNFDTKNEIWVPMINAEFVNKSLNKEIHEEGCLSIPMKFGNVQRSSSVTIKYYDLKGKSHTLKLDGLNARIMQHEMDHLDGILIADHWAKIN